MKHPLESKPRKKVSLPLWEGKTNDKNVLVEVDL